MVGLFIIVHLLQQLHHHLGIETSVMIVLGKVHKDVSNANYVFQLHATKQDVVKMFSNDQQLDYVVAAARSQLLVL